jgi:autotransporter-associated beta strand protein
MNNSGEAVIYGDLIDSQGTSHGAGIFAGASSATLKAIAYDGQAAPNAMGHYTSFDNTLGINDRGQVAYVGYMDGNIGSGVFLGDGTTQKIIALAGQTAPGGGTFTGFGLARANNTGTILFGAQLNGSGTLNALFLSDGVDIIKVAEVGDTVAGTTISQVGIDPKAFNDFRQVVYQDSYSNGSGTDTDIVLFAPRLRWRTDGNGNWDDSTNWTASLTPSTNNDVTIAPTDGGIITGPNNDTSVASLTLSGAGTLLLSGANSYSGSTIVSVGTVNAGTGLTVTSGSTLSLQSGGGLSALDPITVTSGGVLDVETGGVLAGESGLTIATGGTLSLQAGGSVTVAGGTSIASGATLSGAGTISLGTGTLLNQGTLAPGGILILNSAGNVSGLAQKTAAVVKPASAPAPSVGTINITGNLAQTATAALNMNIAGPTSANYSQLLVSGNATLAGTLQVKLTADFLSQMSVNDSYMLVVASGQLSGTFSNVANGARLKTTDGTGSFQVNYTPPPLSFPITSRAIQR